MRYRPVRSVTAVRGFSMSAGLLASTRTPGNAAPDESVTEPAIAAWPNAVTGAPAIQARRTSTLIAFADTEGGFAAGTQTSQIERQEPIC